MKILSAQQIRKADEFTISNEPIPSIDLMERASKAFTQWFIDKITTFNKVIAVCGTGNNGGDGLAISRMLVVQGYDVRVVIVGNAAKGSDDFKTNLERLRETSVEVLYDLPQQGFDADVIIDGLFGSGLSRPVAGEYAKAIEIINSSGITVVSIDIPSGLYCDQPSNEGAVVEADYVVSFQLPKLAFMFPENGRYVKNWQVVDIGLDREYIKSQKTDLQTIEENLVKEIFKKRSKFFHKGQAGKALLVSGSQGKMGASVLCAKAAMRSGLGLLQVHIPKIGNTIMQTAIPEAMVYLDNENDYLSENIDIEMYDVIGVGPGIGTQEITYNALKKYLRKGQRPMVLDADALNIMSEHPELFEIIPENSILTPHPGEFKRMTGSWSDDFERLELQREFSVKYRVIVILKNAHTSITLPDKQVYFNTTGNPGMATGGSGDVLTGILTGLMAQGYKPSNVAIAGTYIHGLAGDLASKRLSNNAMIASDIIEMLPQIFRHIEGTT